MYLNDKNNLSIFEKNLLSESLENKNTTQDIKKLKI